MKNDIKRVLFITEKWCDGDPAKGITNSYHNLFNTFRYAYPDVQMLVAHLDEAFVLGRIHIDTVIPKIIEEHNPDTVIVSHLGSSHMNPTLESYRYIQKRGIPICFTWPDTRDWVLTAIKELDEVSTLNISFGGELTDPIDDKHLNLWAPQDPGMYYPDRQFIPVSFMGSQQGNYTYRREYLAHLLSVNVPIIIGGGQREQALPASEYARMIRSSFIGLNFPESAKPGFDQIKGRVFEIVASKSMLLEKKNDITNRYFEPGIHYIEYEDQFDMVDKIQMYLADGDARNRIAAQAKDYYEANYSPRIFWQNIFSKLGA